MDPSDRISELLDDVLSHQHASRIARLDQLCEQNPELESPLRGRYESLDGLGLLDDDLSGEETGSPIPSQIGRYARGELLGRGGMGLVFAGTDSRDGRDVAIKWLRTEWGPDVAATKRFEREAEIIATLDHAAIARLLDSGSCEGQPFLVVERIHGPGLDALIDSFRNRVPEERTAAALNDYVSGQPIAPVLASWERTIAALLAPIAEALAHAHGRGVIHRDVKPSNILVDREQGPKLLDFGLAGWDEASALTRTGTLLGSAAYMSPEQTLGQTCDAASDVFSLGSTLYELLTMEAPFGRGSSPAVFEAIRDQEPIDLRRRDPGLSADVAAIVTRCLEKQPSRRYPSAEALAADLRALATGAAIQARLPSSSRRMIRFVRRRPWQTTAVASLLVLVIGLSAMAGYLSAKQPVLDAGERAIRADEVAALWEEALFEVLRGDRANAGRILRRLGEDPSQRNEALAYLGEIGLGDPATPVDRVSPALDALRRLIDSERNDAEVLQRAVDSLREVVLSNLRARSTEHALLAFALARTESTSERRAIATGLISIWPDSPFARYWAGYTLLGLDDEAATEHLRRAIAIDPSRSRFHADLGLAELRLGRAEQAEKSLRTALSSAPQDGRTWTSLGHALAALSRFDQSCDAYEQAVTVEPDWPGGHYALGVFQSQRGDVDGAIESFEQTLELAPDYAEALYNLASLRISRGDSAEGVALLTDLTTRRPEWTDAWRALGIAHWQTGDLKSARSAYRIVVELDGVTTADRDALSSLEQALTSGDDR